MLKQLQIKISEADEKSFGQIKKYISEFELDDRALTAKQFLVAKVKNEIVGFGRLRTYEDCEELCSLGVIEKERLKGVGHEICKALIAKSTKPLYLVCIIPQFFEPLGFCVTPNYPKELQDKLNYCTSELIVEETYVVMKKQ